MSLAHYPTKKPEEKETKYSASNQKCSANNHIHLVNHHVVEQEAMNLRSMDKDILLNQYELWMEII